MLAPALFNLYFDVAIRMAIDKHCQEGRGVHIVYHLDANLVGNRKRMTMYCMETWRKMTMETLVTDLEYANDMALVSSSWSDLEAMIRSLNYQCTAMGLVLSSKKTKTLAVLLSPSCQQPEPILLSPGADPVEPVATFQYLGSTVSPDATLVQR